MSNRCCDPAISAQRDLPKALSLPPGPLSVRKEGAGLPSRKAELHPSSAGGSAAAKGTLRDAALRRKELPTDEEVCFHSRRRMFHMLGVRSRGSSSSETLLSCKMQTGGSSGGWKWTQIDGAQTAPPPLPQPHLCLSEVKHGSAAAHLMWKSIPDLC